MALDWDLTRACKMTENAECRNVKPGLYRMRTYKMLTGVHWLVEVKQWIICNSMTTVWKTVGSGRFCQMGKGQSHLVAVILVFWHRICSIKYSVVPISLFLLLLLFARKGLQPVFHQVVYHRVFTLLCTVLSSLVVLFIAILY